MIQHSNNLETWYPIKRKPGQWNSLHGWQKWWNYKENKNKTILRLGRWLSGKSFARPRWRPEFRSPEPTQMLSDQWGSRANLCTLKTAQGTNPTVQSCKPGRPKCQALCSMRPCLSLSGREQLRETPQCHLWTPHDRLTHVHILLVIWVALKDLAFYSI